MTLICNDPLYLLSHTHHEQQRKWQATWKSAKTLQATGKQGLGPGFQQKCDSTEDSMFSSIKGEENYNLHTVILC